MSSPFATDLDLLEIGERFATRGRTITETDVVQFASLTGDMHPQHTDAAWASQSRFGSRIAHGMLVLSYALGLMPLDPDRVVALRRVADAVFKQPVHLGDTIHVEGKIDSVKTVDDGHALVVAQWRILNQDGSVVARACVELLMRRGPVEATPLPTSEMRP
ncbi:MAG: MaoC/PaaZ C-terminal domain-containing protein [Solirubrobacteraceae bacterium]